MARGAKASFESRRREDTNLTEIVIIIDIVPAKAGTSLINRRDAEDAEFLNHNDHDHHNASSVIPAKAGIHSEYS